MVEQADRLGVEDGREQIAAWLAEPVRPAVALTEHDVVLDAMGVRRAG